MYDLRPFVPRDIPEIMGIVHREMRYEYSPEIYLSMHEAWPEGFMLCMVSGRIVGFIMAGITVERELRILLLVVRNGYTSRGIGRWLMDHMVMKARLRGTTVVTLEVRLSNVRAIRFYQGYGMRAVDRIPGFYKDGEDALIFRKDLFS